MDNYVVYHLHSDYSILDSTTKADEYINKAKELGMKSLGFSEHGNIYNWIKKKQKCDKEGIKYMHGVEVYLTESLDEKIRDNYHTILYAKNYEGVKEINKLISLSNQLDHFYYKPRISFDEFLNLSDNIITISACLASPLNKIDTRIKNLISEISKIQEDFFENMNENIRFIDDIDIEIKNETIAYDEKIKRLEDYKKKLINKYDFLEIQPHYKSEDQKIYNLYLYDLSKKYNKKLIMGTDTHEINSYKQECRSILKKAKKILYDNEDDFNLTFRTYNKLIEECEMQDCFDIKVYKEAIENTNLLADMIEDFELDYSFKYPNLYKDDERQYIKIINNKLDYKLKNNIISLCDLDEYKKRLNEEFKAFKKQGMFSYMLFMSELNTWCWENDIPVGYGRGSCTGSVSAYVLDITDVDPIKWNTIFSRFVNEERISLADIDCDYSPQDREKVYEYITNRFGKLNTSYIITFNSISEKGTISEITRALGYDFKTSMLIKDEFEENESLCRSNYPEVFKYYDGLIGSYVSVGIHPCGYISSPNTLNDNIGLYFDKENSVSQCDMKAIDSLNYVKFDILGLKNIGIIKETYRLLGLDYKKSHQINWNDEDVWEDIITSPAGIFQFESSYAFSLLEKFKPRQIDDISLINASLRPSGESYRDKILKREFHNNPTEEIDVLLKNNYGYLVYQEDQIRFMQEICGLSGGEADTVRRAIGKKDLSLLEKMLPKVKNGYIKNSKKDKKIAEKEVEEFLKVLQDSASYAFGFNHSTSYSMLGYTCAYLRYYHPLEFTAAFLNMAQNEDDLSMGQDLAKLKNIKINPITFGKSSSSFDIKDNEIYKGMSSVKYINDKIPNELNELYKLNLSFPELLIQLKNNTSVNTRQLDTLIKINYFNQYGEIGKLLKFTDIFNSLSKKTYKESKIDKFMESYISKHSDFSVNKKTKEKTYKNLDKLAILNDIWNDLEVIDISDLDRIKYRIDYLGYVEDIPKNLSIAKVEMVSSKYKSANLKSLRNNESRWFKFNKDEVSLPSKGDLIVIYDMYKKQGWKGRVDWYVKKYTKL